MTEEQKELLQQANVPMTWWEFCTIKDGTIYTPSTKTLYEKELVSEEEYKYWLSQQEQIDICEEDRPKTNEELTEENKLLKAQLEAATQQQEFLETCVMEMAQVVYA